MLNLINSVFELTKTIFFATAEVFLILLMWCVIIFLILFVVGAIEEFIIKLIKKRKP